MRNETISSQTQLRPLSPILLTPASWPALVSLMSAERNQDLPYSKLPATANPPAPRCRLSCVRITRPAQLRRISGAEGLNAGKIISTITSVSNGGHLLVSTNIPPIPMFVQQPISWRCCSSRHRKSAGTARWNRRNVLRPLKRSTVKSVRCSETIPHYLVCASPASG